MEKDIKYLTVVANKPEELDKWVTAQLKNGWSLYGSPYATSVDEGTFYQALILETKAKVKVGAFFA